MKASLKQAATTPLTGYQDPSYMIPEKPQIAVPAFPQGMMQCNPPDSSERDPAVRWSRIPIPSQRANVFLHHVFQFLGRLGLIFGSALFSVVVFRHLPDLGPQADVFLAVYRGIIRVGCLFAMFCTSLELERLGHAFEGRG